MPPFENRFGLGQPAPAVRAAWQLEHMAVAVTAAQATANAIANAQVQAQSQANVRQIMLTALQEHLAALAPAVATMPGALAHLEAASELASQLA